MFQQVKKNLEEKGYTVSCFASAREAAAYLNQLLDGRQIGIGGSETVRQMGLYEALATHNTVYWHGVSSDLPVSEIRQRASRSPIYISSVNALSEDGIIINIDNTGNRVAAITFGPNQVYLVIGRNKLAPDYESALYRARNTAAPRNALRLNRKTPCAKEGNRCYDCKSPDRICRNFSVLWEKPAGSSYHILLIEEDLGY